jgi:hypothetical protein
MKARITITFDIDSEDYHSVKPTEDSVKELVKAMLNQEADLPENIDIEVIEV